MKKAGIVTIIDNTNYGNRLQNYAMQVLLKENDVKAETIRYSKYSKRKKCIINFKVKLLSVPVVAYLRNYLKQGFYQYDKKTEKLKSKKRRAMERFNRKYIDFSSGYIRERLWPESEKGRYDYYIAGSDQIWNPNYSLDPYIMYLRFAEKNQRIALAASFGVNKIPTEKKDMVRSYLSEMKYISVREEEGRKIVEDLTGNSCEVIIDPTLLIDLSYWKQMINNIPQKLPEKYVVTYFLGDLSQDKKNYIESMAEKNGLKLIHMNNLEDQKTYCWGADMFLKAIFESECIFTDSFHGCIFSILFHKQFYILRREGVQKNIFGRISMLLDMFDLKDRVIDLESELPENISIRKYQEIDKILKKKRIEIKRILNRVLL